MAVLDPVALPEIAAHLRDGTWLDMRVYDEEREWITLENVKVTEYVIRQHNEQVTVVQAWAAEDDSMLRQELALDAEAIRWVRPTENDPTTVRPYEMQGIVLASVDDEWGAVLEAAASERQCTVDELLERVRDGAITVRYTIILLAFHATNLSPDEICRRVGYSSPQPFQSARFKYREDDGFKNRLRLMLTVARQRGCPGRDEDKRTAG